MSLFNSALWCSMGRFNRVQALYVIELCKERKPKTALETGFGTGRSAVSVLYSGSIEKMVSIDKDLSWTGKYKDEILNGLKHRYPFTLVEEDSRAALTTNFFNQEFPNGIDFAFIDGDHSFEGCYCDVSRIYPHLSSDGIMLVDDYTTLDGVRRAVDKFGRPFDLWQHGNKSFAILRTA